MRVAVCGSVDWSDTGAIDRVLGSLLVEHPDLVVFTGMAEGADAIARDWAARHDVDVIARCLDAGPYPAPMHGYNEELIELQPEVVLAFKDGFDRTARLRAHEPGTEHLMRIAAEAGIETRLFSGGTATRNET